MDIIFALVLLCLIFGFIVLYFVTNLCSYVKVQKYPDRRAVEKYQCCNYCRYYDGGESACKLCGFIADEMRSVCNKFQFSLESSSRVMDSIKTEQQREMNGFNGPTNR